MPKAYRRIMQRCLQENPAQRYPSAQALLQVLQPGRKHLLWLSVFLIFAALVAVIFWSSDKVETPKHEVSTTEKSLVGDTVFWYRYYFTGIEDDPTAVELCKVDRSQTVGDLMLNKEVLLSGKHYTLKVLGECAFCCCTELTNLHIPSSVRVIEDGQFLEDVNLRTIVLSDSVTRLGRRSFSGCHKLKDIRLSKGLDRIEDGMFVDCRELNHVKLPSGIRTIEMDAFVSCKQLTDITLPDSLEVLERGVFFNCESLQTITLPSTVTSIGEYTFMQCPQLRSVINKAPTPQPYYDIFDSDFKGTIYVPAASLQRYKEAEGWRDLDIKPIPE